MMLTPYPEFFLALASIINSITIVYVLYSFFKKSGGGKNG